jgi:hypothetical protein
MKIFIQIIKEYWISFVLSIVWLIFNICNSETREEWDLKKIVNLIGPTFFLISWMTGQFFRIKKQTKIEESFGNIEFRFQDILNKFESRTNEIITHITGGDSFPCARITNISNSNEGIFMIIHNGKHPLYDVTARIVDLQKLETVNSMISSEKVINVEQNIHLGNLIPSHAHMIKKWKLEREPYQSYNIFFTARNGSFTQLLRLKKILGVWMTASKVTDQNNKLIFENIDKNFPRNENEKIDW